MEAALLSNTLHEYRDDDVEGVRPVIAKIDSIRQQWREVMKTIQYFDKTGTLPEPKTEQSIFTPLATKAGVAELQLELNRINVNISKHTRKLELTPDHRKAEQWLEDLAKLEALKLELRQNITTLNYAST